MPKKFKLLEERKIFATAVFSVFVAIFFEQACPLSPEGRI